VRVGRWSWRNCGGILLLAVTCLAAALISGCGNADDVSSDASPSALPVASSSAALAAATPSAPQPSDLLMIRAALKNAYSQGQAGEPYKVEPAVMGALKKSFASDPAVFNGASRAVLVWARPIEMPQYGYRSTPTRRYVSVLVWAEGEEMVAAGTVAPGYSQTMMSLSRSSAQDTWQVDGLWGP
jgi:hypothetical protein